MMIPLSRLTRIMVVIAAVAGMSVADGAMKPKKKKRAPVPSPRTTFADLPGGEAVLKAMEKDDYRFTPRVKEAYLDWNRDTALASLQAAGHTLPTDFLAWVNGDPIVKATICIDQAALQRLVLLRSLDIDLGGKAVREDYTQLALALATFHAHLVDPETLSNPDRGISLEPRPLLELEIKRYPMEPVDTRATDRELDREDHIINFLEDNPVTEGVPVTKEEDGKVVQGTEQRSRPRYAYEVMSNPELQVAFNAYMKAHGHDVSIDCGNSINPKSSKKRGIMAAYKMFRKAYEDKGRIPKQKDPHPTPAEIGAYLIRNDQDRLPEGSKHRWPLFDLKSPWPVLKYLAKDDMSLRERDYIWRRHRDGRKVETYGKYIGKIAHSADFVRARNLRPYDYAFDSYPVLVRDGGVCGVTSNIGRRAHIALGVPAIQATQPGHACYVIITGNTQSGFGLSIKQSINTSKKTKIPRYGSYDLEVCRLSAVNYGLPEMLDAMIAVEVDALVPTTVTAEQELNLLHDGWVRNPYYLPLAMAVLNKQPDPAGAVRYYEELAQKLAAVAKRRCYKGSMLAFAAGALQSRLAQSPVPTDKSALDDVRAFLKERSDAIWLKYELAGIGLPALQERMVEDVKAASPAMPKAARIQLMQRIKWVGSAIKDPKQRGAWVEQLLASLTQNLEPAKTAAR